MGCLLRLYYYGTGRSLWFDEALLALNLVKRSFLDLLKPLDNNQGAPIGFLILQKVVISLLGNRDYVLRLIPLLAGLVSVPLMYLVAKQYGGQFYSLVALGLFAVSPRVIYYSSELKQYSTDVLVALLLLFVVPRCLDDKPKPHAFLALGIAGSLAIWLSHPSLFLLAGIILALGSAFAVRTDSHRLFLLIGLGAAWAINLGLVYFVNLRNLGSNNGLLGYWSGSFAPVPPWSDFRWYYQALLDMLKDPATLPVNALTAGSLILGVFSLAYRKWELMLVLVAPFLLTLIASALRRYPFSGRLLLFLVPLLLLLLAEGVQRVWMVLRRVNKPIAGLVTASLIAYFLYGPMATAFKDLQSPPLGEHIKPVMSYISENRLSGDLIYLYYAAEPAFRFYAPLYGFDRGDHVVGITSRRAPDRYLDDIEKKVKGSERIWFVFTHNCSWCMVNEQDFLLQHLDAIGQKRNELTSYGASVFLYDLGQGR